MEEKLGAYCANNRRNKLHFIHRGGRPIFMLLFADDVVLLARTAVGMELLV